MELYQQLLTEAVDEENGGASVEKKDQFWSPQIELGAAILIPEMYVPDLSVRLGLYRRLGALESQEELETFAVELVDRFGSIPPETEHLLRVVRIKQMCRSAYVIQVDAGPRGAVLTFFNDSFPAGEKLVGWITGGRKALRLRPDQKLVISENWRTLDLRFAGVENILRVLSDLIGSSP